MSETLAAGPKTSQGGVGGNCLSSVVSLGPQQLELSTGGDGDPTVQSSNLVGSH